MNRMMRALQGEAVWPPPIWLMRQAGRYLPEYRELRAKAGDFITLCTTPELAAEVTLQPVRRFGMDAAILFSDILILPWALGWGLSFQEGEGPVLPKFQTENHLALLDPRRIPEAIAPVLQTVRLVSEALDPVVPLIGFAGAPFTVACYLVEGGGSKDFSATRLMAYAQPELFAGLIDLLTTSTIAYLAAQVDAGARIVMLFDSYAGMLAPTLFRGHVIEPTQRIVAELKRRYPTLPIIGFPRLAGMMLGTYAAATLVDGVGMDTAVDPLLASALVPDSVALQGNLDPMTLLAGGPALKREVRAILDTLHGRPFIFNLGHGIVPATPPDHVAELIQLVRAG
jgi:uroporphyrinogen decarboxylase